MALIIPQAQTPLDPVQQPRQSFDTPNVGDALATVGNTLVAYQAEQVQRQRDQDMRNARVTAIEKIGALRTQYEQDPSITGLSQRFDQATTQAIEEVAQTLPQGRMRTDFLLDARQVRAPQVEAIARREYALQGDAARAQATSAMRTYVTEAASAPDPQSRAAIMSEAAAHIGSLQDSGYITAEQEEAMLSGIVSDTAMITAVRTSAEDPAAFLEANAAGDFAGVDPMTLTRMEIAARDQIAAAEATAARTAAATAEVQAKARAAKVADAARIIEGGLPYAGLADLQAEVAGTPEAARLEATVAAARTEGRFAILSPDQMDQTIADLSGRGTQDPTDLARIDRLQAMRDRAVDSLQRDPLQHVADRDILNVEPVDLADPASVLWRISQSEAVAQDFQSGDAPPQVRYFTNAERDSFKQALTDGGADAQLALASNIVNTFGDRAGLALSEIGGDDALFQLAGNLVWQTRDPGAARVMLQGRKMLADKTGAKVDATVRGSVRPAMAEAFMPGAQDRVASLMEAADAHFAAAGMMMNPDADDATKRAAYERSLQAVAGQVTVNGQTFGGIQAVNERRTVLPPTVTGAMAETALRNATAAQWAKASISGNAPEWGGDAIGAERWKKGWGGVGNYGAAQDLRLMSIGGGQYLIGVTRRNGEVQYLTDPGNRDGLARIDLAALVKAGSS